MRSGTPFDTGELKTRRGQKCPRTIHLLLLPKTLFEDETRYNTIMENHLPLAVTNNYHTQSKHLPN